MQHTSNKAANHCLYQIPRPPVLPRLAPVLAVFFSPGFLAVPPLPVRPPGLPEKLPVKEKK